MNCHQRWDTLHEFSATQRQVWDGNSANWGGGQIGCGLEACVAGADKKFRPSQDPSSHRFCVLVSVRSSGSGAV